MKERRRLTGKSYTYRVLWTSANRLLKQGQNSDVSFDFFLSSMIMAFFVLEGYVNHLGERIAPKVWINEKSFFSEGEGKYRGTLGKLSYLAEQAEHALDMSRRPYQSIRHLHKLRQLIVHARTEQFDIEVEFAPAKGPDFRKSQLQQAVNGPMAKRVLKDVKTLVEALHIAAKEKFGTEVVPEPEALIGILGGQSA